MPEPLEPPEPRSPTVGATVTLLFDIGATPMTESVRIAALDGAAIVIERGEAAAESPLTVGTEVTLFYEGQGRLEGAALGVARASAGRCRLEPRETQPDSERRQFVRADVELRVRVAPHGGGAGRWHEGTVDLSASGFCLAADGPYDTGDLFDVRMRPIDDGPAESEAADDKPKKKRQKLPRDEVHAVARVARTVAPDGRPEFAFEFVELGSVAENRVMRLVFDARIRRLADLVEREP